MKTLYQSLMDYEMALLKTIANCRAMPLTTSDHAEAVKLLTEALLSPAAMAIVLADLAEREKEALQFLLDNNGQIEGPRFTRQYGSIRPIGPARLEREQPWQTPANPAEGLWYRGLIFKTFQVTKQGSLEIVYIPEDLLSLLEISNLTHRTKDFASEGEDRSAESFTVSQMPVPNLIVSGNDRLRENIFSLLVYLQTTPIRLERISKLTVKDKEALASCLLPPLLPTFTIEAELDFLLHLGQRAGLLVIKHGRLRPDRDPTRNWLQLAQAEQVRQLQNVWRADPTWNDLWHVPSLIPQPTGWENSPLLGRSKILGYLSQLEAAPDSWFSVNDFVAAVKRVEPDFQRPNGDYESWYIYDTQGNSLMGFTNWDKVEGALIRYLLSHLLPLLGIIDLGLPAETSAPVSFRLTPSGENLLRDRPSSEPSSRKFLFLRVDANFYAYVPTHASLYDRFQLARFAQLDRQEKGRTVYHITQDSISRALRNGVTADQITAFLARATNNQTPLKVVETLRAWGARQDSVHLERVTLLHLKHESLVAELRQHPILGSLLGEVIGPKTIIVPASNTSEVERLLIELGYLMRK